MSVLAVISEYNPYHKGHAYLLEQAREITGAEYAVSVMSGCFSQQGLPMTLDKYLRAEAATRSGIDLVFELPVLFATGSAPDFAEGAVTLLSRLSLPEYLVFGVENPDTSAFLEIADCITEEPEAFRSCLQERQKEGLSFPAAREEALAAVLGDSVRPLVRTPNNILALEYMAALKRVGSRMKPCLVKRTADYHSGTSASATGIRNRLAAMQDSSLTTGPSAEPEGNTRSDAKSYLKGELPEGSYTVYQPCADQLILSPDGLMPYLAARMLELTDAPSPDSLPLGMTPEMYQRLRKQSLPVDYETLVEGMKRKNETRGRITRSLLHLILGVTEGDRLSREERCMLPLYLNLLSARRESTHLLRLAPEGMIITRNAAFHPEERKLQRLWELDLKASRLYNQLMFSAHGIELPEELRRTPAMV